MNINPPVPAQIPALRTLWKKAFGDTDAFLDVFFSTGYAPERCRCITAQEGVLAALYWLDMTCEGQNFAYIYAVATDPDHRGKGLCRCLMEDTARVLKEAGYQGAMLVPQDTGLRVMYSKMGYLPAAPIEESFHAAGSLPVSAEGISCEDYAARRKDFLPEGSVMPGNEALVFLNRLAQFYAGAGFLAAVSQEPEHLRILEYLGSDDKIPALIASLGRTEATVRKPGSSSPFAMYLPLTESCTAPGYFPFCFD